MTTNTKIKLEEIIRPFKGNERTYLLLRLSGMEKKTALGFIGLTEAAYDAWMRKPTFSRVHRNIDALSVDHKREAITFLRRDNQLRAVLLERKLIEKIESEIDCNNLVFTKTTLAKTLYERLLSEVDFQPSSYAPTWEDRRQFFLQPAVKEEPPQIEEPLLKGEYYGFSETDNSKENEH